MSGVPGGGSDTNLFNFGPELDRIDHNVATLLANQTTFFTTIESQLKVLVTSLSQQVASINGTIAQMAVLLEAAIVGFHSVGTLANQQIEIGLLNDIMQNLTALKPQTIGLDTTMTVEVPQPQPSKPGP